jgi:hypothetical protein
LDLPYKFGVDIAKNRNADMPNLQNSNLADDSGCPETSRKITAGEIMILALSFFGLILLVLV